MHAQLVLHFRGSSLWYAQGSNLCYVNDIALTCSSKTCSVDTATKLIAIDLHSPSTGYILGIAHGDFCAVKNAIAVHVQLTWRALVSVIVNAGGVKREWRVITMATRRGKRNMASSGRKMQIG